MSMISNFDNHLHPEFNNFLDNDERLLWTERPRFTPFILTNFFGYLAGIAFLIIIFIATRNIKFEGDENGFWGQWMLLFIAATIVWSFIKRLFSFRNTSYAYSNKRVMIKTGFMSSSIKIIEFDKIIDVEVTASFIHKYSRVGTVKFFCGHTKNDDGDISKVYDSWEAIPNPYEAFKDVKQAIADLKKKQTFGH